MTTGTIKTLRDDKGYGFITPDGTTGRHDVFFHQSAVNDVPFDDLHVGEHVTFDVQPDPRDPSRERAVNVTRVQN